jgi:hypothetical protein
MFNLQIVDQRCESAEMISSSVKRRAGSNEWKERAIG